MSNHIAEKEKCNHENYRVLETQLRVYELENEVSKKLLSSIATYYKLCTDCNIPFDVNVITSNTNLN